jgi:hypothetical protein
MALQGTPSRTRVKICVLDGVLEIRALEAARIDGVLSRPECAALLPRGGRSQDSPLQNANLRIAYQSARGFA